MVTRIKAAVAFAWGFGNVVLGLTLTLSIHGALATASGAWLSAWGMWLCLQSVDCFMGGF